MPTKTQALQDALELCVKEMCKYCQESAEAMPHAIPSFNGCKTMRIAKEALDMPFRNCDVMSLESAKKLWLAKEIMPRLDGDLPLGKEILFDEWFVSQLEQGAKGEGDGR